MTELVLPNDTNLLGNLLGGRLLHWIDIAGAMTATRHAESLVATVKMDAIIFKYPIHLGNIVTLTSYVTWTGNTSIEVAVEVHTDNPLAPDRKLVNKVYIVFVALDAEGRKHPVIPFIPATAEEMDEFNEAPARRGLQV
jgi:acyl-CoA hydrolase